MTGARSGYRIRAPESELCELNDADCRDSELVVLRLPSLVLECRDSMLPEPLLDDILSVDEIFLVGRGQTVRRLP